MVMMMMMLLMMMMVVVVVMDDDDDDDDGGDDDAFFKILKHFDFSFQISYLKTVDFKPQINWERVYPTKLQKSD